MLRHIVVLALATVEAWEASSGRRALPSRMPPAVAAITAVDSLQDVLRAAGLDEPQVEEVWVRRPPGKLPGAVRQTALLEWLQSELDGEPERYSYLCLRKAPQLMLEPHVESAWIAGAAACLPGPRTASGRGGSAHSSGPRLPRRPQR